jgi:lysophospholipase L1-like esterase
MDLESFANHYEKLITHLREMDSRVLMLGLLPVGEYFPDSAAQFERVNKRLQDLATTRGVDFFDWASPLKANGFKKLFYRDTFHPNAEGAKELARILKSKVSNGTKA